MTMSVSLAHYWTPPEGMSPAVASAWAQFYRSALAKYELSPRQYRVLYLAQMGRCWVCRVAKGIHPDDPKGRGSRRLGIDHDHLTGAVRGLLCTGSLSANTCNRLIERYTPQALERAAKYKRNPPARVLAEVDRVREQTRGVGAPWTDEDEVRLATAMLWMDQERADDVA